MSKEKPHIDSATMLRLLTAAARDEKATPEVLEKYGNMTEQECHEILLDFIQEERDLHRLCMRQADLLTGVVNAIRGKPPARTLWSHHDAPELAEKVVAELAMLRTNHPSPAVAEVPTRSTYAPHVGVNESVHDDDPTIMHSPAVAEVERWRVTQARIYTRDGERRVASGLPQGFVGEVVRYIDYAALAAELAKAERHLKASREGRDKDTEAHHATYKAFMEATPLTDEQKRELSCYVAEYVGRGVQGVWWNLAQAIASMLNSHAALAAQLAQYQQFAAYCRSCALSGESDPQTFEQFVETMKAK